MGLRLDIRQLIIEDNKMSARMDNIGSLLLAAALCSAAVPSPGETLQYTYDSARRLTRVTYGNGTAVDYVYDNLGNRLTETTTLVGAPSNRPPSAVSAPGIANGVTDVSNSPTLTWNAAVDPDTGDAVVYSVYFGATPNPPLAYSGGATNWSPGHLNCFSTYYWQVVARDNRNAQTASPLWSFTTRNESPVVDFVATPVSGTAPLVVHFQDQSTYRCGAMVSWQWDFNNDGIVDSTDRNPVFTYPSTVGDYTVRLKVSDEHGGESTLVKTNFTSVLGNNIVDLAPLALNIVSAASYRNLVVTYSVTNRGTILVSGKWQWADNFYVSTKSSLDSTATLVATIYENKSLPPGTGYTRTNLVPIPEVAAENYYVLLKVDGNSQLGEINENNNVLAIPLRGRLPELRPATLAWSGPALAGQPLDVSYTVTNRGALDLVGLGGNSVEWLDGFYLSSNAVWDAQAASLGAAVNDQTLAAGAGYTATNLVLLPAWAPGNYYLILRANDWGELVESSAANGSLAIPLTLAAPDLRPVSLSAPSGVPSDQEVAVVYAVTNLSSVPADGYWVDAFVLSINSVWEASDYPVGQRYQVGPVAGRSGYAATNLVRLPGWPAGTYYLILKVNSQQSLSETAATNNTLAVPLVLTTPSGLPDLSPVSLSAPPVGIAGQAIQVSYMVTNWGSLMATGMWSDVFWLSTNPVWDKSGAYVAASTVIGPIPSQGSYARTNAVNLPLVEPGDYYLFLQANAFDQLYESATNNNFRSVPIQVEASVGLADLVPLALTAPASAAPGQSISMTYTVRNFGDVPATGAWMDVIWLSTNAVWDGDGTFLAFSMQNGPVSTGGSYVQTTTATLPVVPIGNYYLILDVDMAQQVFEVDYDNNTLAVPVTLMRQNLAPVLSGAVYLSDGRFQLAFSGAIGTNYTIQASTNLVDWVPVLHFTCTNSPVLFRDTAATNYTHRFYRGVLP